MFKHAHDKLELAWDKFRRALFTHTHANFKRVQACAWQVRTCSDMHLTSLNLLRLVRSKSKIIFKHIHYMFKLVQTCMRQVQTCSNKHMTSWNLLQLHLEMVFLLLLNCFKIHYRNITSVFYVGRGGGRGILNLTFSHF